MDDILPTIPENTSLDSKLVLNLDAEFVSPIANNEDILSSGNYIIMSDNIIVWHLVPQFWDFYTISIISWILGSSSTDYSGDVNYTSIINAVDEVGKYDNILPEKDSSTNMIKKEDDVTSSSIKPTSEAVEQDEIYRSLKINDASKTPYSDATQVRWS